MALIGVGNVRGCLMSVYSSAVSRYWTACGQSHNITIDEDAARSVCACSAGFCDVTLLCFQPGDVGAAVLPGASEDAAVCARPACSRPALAA